MAGSAAVRMVWELRSPQLMSQLLAACPVVLKTNEASESTAPDASPAMYALNVNMTRPSRPSTATGARGVLRERMNEGTVNMRTPFPKSPNLRRRRTRVPRPQSMGGLSPVGKHLRLGGRLFAGAVQATTAKRGQNVVRKPNYR